MLGALLLSILCVTPSLGLRPVQIKPKFHRYIHVIAKDLESEGDNEGSSISVLSQAATGIFSSYRIPAALLAGAAYGGTFNMPLNMNDDLSKQLIKRSYVVIGLATVCAELLAVVISTCAIDKLAVGYNFKLFEFQKLFPTGILGQ